jgi:hypothetical protein
LTRTLTAATLCVALAACGEKPQTGGAVKHDAAPYAGTGSNFTQPGWTAGDKTSWERSCAHAPAVRSERVFPQPEALSEVCHETQFLPCCWPCVLAAQAQAPAGPTASGVAGPGACRRGCKAKHLDEARRSAEPGYAEQTNGERMKVQPGNNAPMWRQVGQGVTGYSSLPKRRRLKQAT